ncbi:MAG TPA: hypothetical protein VKK79_20700, partial [Candidatus Lokiarchaeia archaeon]|nr:hypothetical protein [Candidatus Lokiarchaeia archaeon]
MRFFDLFREIIGENWPRLFLQIEDDLLNYLKEFLLTKIKKDPEFFDQQVDFFEDNFAQTLKKMVESFTDGLESIGISPAVTSRKFYFYLKEITNDPELKTPGTWIYQRFRPFIRLLLVDELVHFFEGAPGNIIEKFHDFDVISKEVYESLIVDRDKLPKFTQFVRSFNSLHGIYQDVEKIEKLLLFERMEENLQTMYFLTQILNDIEELKRLNAGMIKEFLIQNQDEWMKKTPIIGPSLPSTVLSAVTIIDLLNIQFDLSPILEKQKETIEHLLEISENPLQSKSPELYDSLLSIYTIQHEFPSELVERLKDLTLSEDLFTSDLSVPTLGAMLDIIFFLNPAYEIPENILEKMKDHVQQYRIEGGMVLEVGDDAPQPVATYYGYKIFKRINALESEDLGQFFQYFISAMEKAIKYVDYAIPETVAEVFYCKQFFNALESESDFKDLVKNLLDCPTPEGEDFINFCDAEKLEEEFTSSRKMAAQEIAALLRAPRRIPESNQGEQISAQISRDIEGLPLNVEPIEGTVVGMTEVPDGPIEENAGEIANEISPFTPEKAQTIVSVGEIGDLFNILGAYPPLAIDKLEKFRINYQDLVVPPASLWKSLQQTSRYFAVLQMLSVNINQSAAEIRDNTRQFVAENGFLGDDLSGVDIYNTFHGLVLYKQFDLLSALPLDQIQGYLIGELDYCMHLNIEKTAFIVMALKVINQDILIMPDLLPKIQDFQVGNFMNFEETYKFEEYFYLSIVLKAFNFETVMREVMDAFATELASLLDPQGAIERMVTQTALAYIAAQLIGIAS